MGRPSEPQRPPLPVWPPPPAAAGTEPAVPPPAPPNTSGQGKGASVPAEIDGKWNWCAFLFPTVFAGINRLWLWLFITAAPVVLISRDILPGGLIGESVVRSGQLLLSIILAKRGNALAWRNRRWDSIEHFRRTHRRWAWGSLVALIAFLGLLVFAETRGGGSQPMGSSGDRASTGSAAFHRAHLAEGETASLAAMLIDVPGYLYVDASELEVQDALGRFDPGSLTGLSLHAVVDGQDTEIAFLQLYDFAPGVLPAKLPDSKAVSAFMGESPRSEALVGGQKVFLFEFPDLPESRYFYVWLMDGTMAAADAGDQQRLLGWMRVYLSSRGERIYAARGVSLSYPREWGVREIRGPYAAGSNPGWSLVIDPVGERYRYEYVRINAFASGGAPARKVARELLDTLAQEEGTVEGPTPTSIGGQPAFEGRVVDYALFRRPY